MKKLNRKGFTLIELLAVIVILAIILVVTVPNIINSINDARVSSIHNLAVSAANTYDNAFAQDLVGVNVNNKLLGTIPEYVSTEWQCLDKFSTNMTSAATAAAVTDTTNLVNILGLSTSDIVLSGTGVTAPANSATSFTSSNCSSIRIMSNGSAEILLIAKNGGKFYVAQYHTYAISSADNGSQTAA